MGKVGIAECVEVEPYRRELGAEPFDEAGVSGSLPGVQPGADRRTGSPVSERRARPNDGQELPCQRARCASQGRASDPKRLHRRAARLATPVTSVIEAPRLQLGPVREVKRPGNGVEYLPQLGGDSLPVFVWQCSDEARRQGALHHGWKRHSAARDRPARTFLAGTVSGPAFGGQDW
jgi:hypothetical protein